MLLHIFVLYQGLLCAIIYKQWVLNNGSLVNFINKIIIFVQLKIIILIPQNLQESPLFLIQII